MTRRMCHSISIDLVIDSNSVPLGNDCGVIARRGCYIKVDMLHEGMAHLQGVFK